ncbi:MAG: hypothetical protein AB1426_05120 [Bacillota bacterium]
MPGTSLTRPPENFKPDPKKGIAWCPYCGGPRAFVWDGYTRYARCPGCGISTDDFHTRTHNGFWNSDAKEKFDRAVKDSGRFWPREVREEEQEPLRLPTWRPPENEMAWVEVSCPSCGRHIRDAYPPTRDLCRVPRTQGVPARAAFRPGGTGRGGKARGRGPGAAGGEGGGTAWRGRWVNSQNIEFVKENRSPGRKTPAGRGH